MTQEMKKEIISNFLNRGVLISPEFLEKINSWDEENLTKVYSTIKDKNLTAKELELYTKDKKEVEQDTSKINVVFSYKRISKKLTTQDFVEYFNARFVQLEKLLRNRKELQYTVAIKRLKAKKEKEHVAVIGMVKNKEERKNGTIIITLEDQTDEIGVIITKSKSDLYELCKEVVLDEVIGVVGTSGNKIIFASSIIFPDIPNQEIKKSPKEEYAIFISDLHFGSRFFLYEEFKKFVRWVNGEFGSDEQREIAKKLKYVFIAGDLVDGVGIYPLQDEDLDIKDIYEQYKEFSNFLKEIPEHLKIVVCPGNHDAMRVAEPQPLLYQDFAKSVWDLPNVIIVSNPSMINFGACEGFPGFNLLFYHGYSFPYYADIIENIRKQGGQERPDLIIKLLLQKRHLAPTHASSLTMPDSKTDPLVISQVPDFLVTGHIHRTSITNYKGVTNICCSCWTSITEFQEKLGLKPQPSRVPVINLQTRQAKILKF